MTKIPNDGIKANAPMQYYCVECGKAIEGEPFEMSMAAWEDSIEPVYFCSKACWERSEEFNTENWPD